MTSVLSIVEGKVYLHIDGNTFELRWEKVSKVE